jgi:hypothetical protein
MVLVLAAAPSLGGWRLFRKADQPDADQVMQLIHKLRNDRDADRRAEAAEELRHVDAQKYPEIVPMLIEALEKDSSSGVRREAAQSLGRIRPTSHEAAKALESAAENDDSALVRLRARAARIGYRAEETPPSSMPAPKAGRSVVVPPPDPDGRLRPVPLPAPLPKAASRPLPMPAVLPSGPQTKASPLPLPARATPEGPILWQPKKAAATPPQAPAPAEQEDGPILIAPKP